MAVVFQVNAGGGANEIEVDDAGLLKLNNVDVSTLISAPEAFIADPTGAVTDTDDEARAAIAAILDLLIAKGLMAAE